MIFIIILAIVFCIAVVVYFIKSNKDNANKTDSMNNSLKIINSCDYIELWNIVEPVLDHEEISETWTTNVAGVSMYCSEKEIGGIVGYVESEPTNSYNTKAMAVYSYTGKRIGYIYESELEDYRSWSRCKKLPFVGYIQSAQNGVSARIHIIVPKSREFLLDRAGKFYISTKENGKTFLIPKVKDMVVPDREQKPIQPDVETNLDTRNENWGYSHGYMVRDPKSIPPATIKYHMSSILGGDGYALYHFLEEHKGKVIDIDRFATYRNPDKNFIASDKEAINLMTKQLDELIFCNIALVKWVDLTHFTFELLQTIPINEEWERKRKWKQWIKQA